MEQLIGEALFANGFTDLISISPPGATLVPTSKIHPASLGKVPARRTASGLWAGYDWRKHPTTLADVRRWALDGANLGLRSAYYPAVDIDCTDAALAALIERIVVDVVGAAAPVRTGKAPKRLLMFRTDAPFTRLRLNLQAGETTHLVEILGDGQQYLVGGVHPGTGRPYSWDRDITQLTPGQLPVLTRELAVAVLDAIAETLETLGVATATRQGDGRAPGAAPTEQRALVAPSLEVLRDAVAVIPNTLEVFPDYDSYIKFAYAINAASGEELEEGYHIFASWALRWEGNDRAAAADPEQVRSDWRRIKGEKRVGWPYVAEIAGRHGYNVAALEFEPEVEERDSEVGPPKHSDQWLARRVAERRRSDLRYVPMQRRWVVWDGSRWVPDPKLMAEDIVKQELTVVADGLMRSGATDKEKAAAAKKAESICSADRAAGVRRLMQSDRHIAISPTVLDHDPWLLNTPAGIVDLRTGTLGTPDPDQMCTRSTAVPPDFAGVAPRWEQFLEESTGGDASLIRYLQRLAGYCLTGVTTEQMFAFLHGGGGNGKGTFINTIAGILRDYAVAASMDTFTASKHDRHTTELAMLQGARLVTASETQAGRSWDEARVKLLTGGDPITARFMREDNFTYLPQFKLVFLGNHRPAIRDLDRAMKRRLHLVPFTFEPKVVDTALGAKLRDEWPAILAWMIQGCLAWQAEGLTAPGSVQAATEDYFRDEDAVGRWLDECCTRGEGATTTHDLFQSWREWANQNGEYDGSIRRLSAALITRGFAKWRHPESRRNGFAGITLKDVGNVALT